MVEYNNKHQKDIGTTEDSTKHKKKSNKKGLSRSKHKHENTYVRLIGFEKYKPTRLLIASVCKVCGRIDDTWYVEKDKNNFHYCPVQNIEELPLYKTDVPWGKFAKPVEKIKLRSDDNG